MKAREILIAVYIKCNGDWDAIYNVIKNKERVDVESLIEGVDPSRYVTILDKDYPEYFKQSYKPPFVFER